MEDNFKKQMKEQIVKIENDIYEKVGEWKKMKGVIAKLRAEKANMKRTLGIKIQPGRPKKEHKANKASEELPNGVN